MGMSASLLSILFQSWAKIRLVVSGILQSHKKHSLTSKHQPPLHAGLIQSCKSKQRCLPASRSSSGQSTARHDESCTQTSSGHNHKSHPRKHTLTTSLHKHILQYHGGNLLADKSLLRFFWEQQVIKPLCARTWLFSQFQAPCASWPSSWHMGSCIRIGRDL